MKPQSILLIEDEFQQREVLSLVLESEGYAVTSVETAEAGLTHLSKEIPSMVITDVKLPGMDGFSLYEKLRQGDVKAEIPFIFITGYNDVHAIEKAKSLGALGYVTKPYNLEDLLAIVKKFLPV